MPVCGPPGASFRSGGDPSAPPLSLPQSKPGARGTAEPLRRPGTLHLQTGRSHPRPALSGRAGGRAVLECAGLGPEAETPACLARPCAARLEGSRLTGHAGSYAFETASLGRCERAADADLADRTAHAPGAPHLQRRGPRRGCPRMRTAGSFRSALPFLFSFFFPFFLFSFGVKGSYQRKASGAGEVGTRTRALPAPGPCPGQDRAARPGAALVWTDRCYGLRSYFPLRGKRRGPPCQQRWYKNLQTGLLIRLLETQGDFCAPV